VRIGVRRVHLEEDTAKLTHVEAGGEAYSLIDFNRSGMPLMEIVSEPDMHSIDQVQGYITKLRAILRYLGVSSGNMEEGAMRCEANISLKRSEAAELGVKVEVKNLNSFRAVEQALAYEIERQSAVLDRGGRVQQVTMGWDDVHGVTVVQRSKEEANDYRYFPEPDLPPLCLSGEQLQTIRDRLPELPDRRRERFVAQYGLSAYDARLLTSDRSVAEFFEAAVRAFGDAKVVCNWIVGEIFRLLKANEQYIDSLRISPDHLAELLVLVDGGTISMATAKEVLGVMFDTGTSARAVVAERGLLQISDQDELRRVVEQVIGANPKAVADFKAGKEMASSFLMGQVMRLTRGKANPAVVKSLIEERLR
jgi:aspartyl-tRNA(Asn)/glutamyl-tRNA(Gln) amidotransferase subunit B